MKTIIGIFTIAFIAFIPTVAFATPAHNLHGDPIGDIIERYEQRTFTPLIIDTAVAQAARNSVLAANDVRRAMAQLTAVSASRHKISPRRAQNSAR